MKIKSVLRMTCVLSVLLVVPGYSQNIFDEIRQGRTENVKKLIEKDPELVHTRIGGIYPLHQAVRHGRMEIAKFLISKGADVNKFGKDVTEFAPFEFTPVTEAIRSNNIDMIKMFVAEGADVNRLTSMGESYLHFAAFLNRPDLAEYFIDLGLNVDIRKNGNMSPLHIAVIVGNREVAELLIRKGADLDLRSTDGGTPLHFAIAAGHQEIAEFLRSRGAKDAPRNFPLYKGKYLGIKKPGLTPEPFAPELFRDIYRVHSVPAFSPDGREVYWECIFMLGKNDVSRVWFMKEEKSGWSEPKVAPFSKYPSGGPAFFHDGNKLIYSSMRPRDNSTIPAKDLDLWIVERKGDSWGNPEHLETPLNKDGTFEVLPIVAKDGTIYLKAGYREGYVKSAFVDGEYSKPERIGDPFDTDVVDTCKEQEHILFFSDRGRDERYEYEIYISYHQPDGRWSKPVYLGDKLHPGRRATQAITSLNGKYLFFVSYFHFYWVDARIIEDLKPQEFINK
jgi:ankyrin repeat protein